MAALAASGSVTVDPVTVVQSVAGFVPASQLFATILELDAEVGGGGGSGGGRDSPVLAASLSTAARRVHNFKVFAALVPGHLGVVTSGELLELVRAASPPWADVALMLAGVEALGLDLLRRLHAAGPEQAVPIVPLDSPTLSHDQAPALTKFVTMVFRARLALAGPPAFVLQMLAEEAAAAMTAAAAAADPGDDSDYVPGARSRAQRKRRR